MSKYITFCTVGVHSKEGRLTDISVVDFLLKIDLVQKQKDLVIKNVNGKAMRLFSFYRTTTNTNGIIAVPFGKFRTDKPLSVSDVASHILKELPNDIVEVNSVYIDENKHIALLTNNGHGPKAKDIEAYLNEFLKSTDFEVRLTPIIIDIGEQALRAAQVVTSLTITVDLGGNLNGFFQKNIVEEKSFANQFRKITQSANDDFNANTMQFTINMGREKKSGLTKDSVLAFLDAINIDASCIKEIVATLQNGTQEALEVAKLKNSAAELKSVYKIKGNQISTEVLINNAIDIYSKKSNVCYPKVREYTNSVLNIDSEYDIAKEVDQTAIKIIEEATASPKSNQ